jgi:hypothetical protein
MLKTLDIACVVFEDGAAYGQPLITDISLRRARRGNLLQCRIGSLAFCCDDLCVRIMTGAVPCKY